MPLNDRDTYAPLILFEYDDRPGHYCLLLGDQHMVALDDVFEQNGQENNGYAWEAVARQAVRAHAPDIGKLGFDPEAGMFVAYGEDLDALKRLGALLRDAFHNRQRLTELIRDADPDWWD
jgi:Immunity protein 51